MKSCMLLLLVLAGTVYSSQVEVTTDLQEEIEKLVDYCITETGADLELVQKLHHGRQAVNRPIKCFVKCMLISLDYMDDKGKLNVEGIVEDFESEEDTDVVMKIVENCNDMHGADLCEVAYNVHMCAMEIIERENA